MDLRELGMLLREERERQGLSLDEVSEKIKITRSCLTAIEEGNESALPHPVYAKGFIKNYAKMLGVDQETFAKGLAEVYQVEELSLHNAPILQNIPDDDGDGVTIGRSSRFRVLPSLVVLVIVLLVAGLGWYLYTHVFAKSSAVTESPAPQTTKETTSPEKTAMETSRPVPTVPMAQPSDTKSASTEPAAASNTESSTPATPTTKAEPTADDRATQDIATSSSPTVPTSGQPAAPAAPTATTPPAGTTGKSFSVGDTGSHTVTIVASDRCWVQAGADGGTMHDAMLEKGDTLTGRFSEYLLVRLGNAGAVQVHFDNKLYPLQASKGSVKTLKFVAKKNEEAPKPTPTDTPAPAQPNTGAVTSDQTTAPTATAENTAATAKEKEVEIYGQDGSWVIVNPDKGPAKEVYVKKGQHITFPFNEKIEIRLGNPSSVVFRYDGKETPISTEKGESKTIRFPEK